MKLEQALLSLLLLIMFVIFCSIFGYTIYEQFSTVDQLEKDCTKKGKFFYSFNNSKEGICVSNLPENKNSHTSDNHILPYSAVVSNVGHCTGTPIFSSWAWYFPPENNDYGRVSFNSPTYSSWVEKAYDKAIASKASYISSWNDGGYRSYDANNCGSLVGDANTRTYRISS